MSSRSDQLIQHLVTKAQRTLRRIARGTQDEDVGTGEKVQVILRKEGEEVKPADMQCEARRGKGRCKNDKFFDMESGNWLRWCEDHQSKEIKARAEGGPRVERFVEPEPEEE